MQFTVAPNDRGRLTVAGASIAYATWGEARATPILLVHGAGAHMGWWDTVIAELAPRHRVIALELSGNGDSEWRRRYDGELWAEEVITIARQIGGGPCLVVGHSLGGRVAIVAAARGPELVLGPVLIDTPVRPPGRRRSRLFFASTRRRYNNLDHAISKFGLLPSEPVDNQEMFHRVAAGAFRELEGKWMLKADAAVFGRVDDDTVASCLPQLTRPLTFVYGDRSALIDDTGLEFLLRTHAGPTQLLPVAGGYHHLTFDHGPVVAQVIEATAAELARQPAASGA